MDRAREWLEADGLGGFSSGTVSGVRTRRYHALLLAATRPPSDRVRLVSSLETWVEGPFGTRPLSSHTYGSSDGDVIHPDGIARLRSFHPTPWPTWRHAITDRLQIRLELLVPRGLPLVLLRWVAEGGVAGATLHVRPLLSVCDFHALAHENDSARMAPERLSTELLAFRLYQEMPGLLLAAGGNYAHAPDWYRNFVLAEERARGLDRAEDLAAPGVLSFDLDQGEATCILALDTPQMRALLLAEPARPIGARLLATERARRAEFASPLERAADLFLVEGRRKTVVAGYPWFGDWGRDTLIALRGLCLATGRLDDARDILLDWSDAVSEGMLPNRFPDRGEVPEFNAVDASLWYVIVARELLDRLPGIEPDERRRIEAAMVAILEGYARGTRHRIHLDGDGLLAAGEPGVQLTWMDAKVGDWVVTPRTGKPVEIQALWMSALSASLALWPRAAALLDKAQVAFGERFWNPLRGCLLDVVDVDHMPGKVDDTVRPNQILAAGGLPFCPLPRARARAVVDLCEARLLTPLGLRSLEPGAAGYHGRYEGGVRSRDGAYHQGTVWPWLLGPFVEAWLRTRDGSCADRQEARTRFLAPLMAHLDHAGLGHVSEITDADPPHTPRGCPFQAWSLGELLRISRMLA